MVCHWRQLIDEKIGVTSKDGLQNSRGRPGSPNHTLANIPLENNR